MLYLIVIMMGGLVGLLLKGKISNLFLFKFKKAWIIVLAFATQLTVKIMESNGLMDAAKYSLLIQGIVYSLLFLGFWFNRKQLGILVIGAGSFLNAVVIMANGGKMPVSFEALKKADILHTMEAMAAGLDGKHSMLDSHTNLKFLADIISLPEYLGYLMPVVSIGDLVIALGVFLLAAGLIIGNNTPERFGQNKNGGFINEKVD
ncbi:MAG: DUF5317 domain-containing protein [Clostridia bacterium]|nr:DUF5317 domain-containing protein [Clostridia bacterium]